MAAQLTLTWWPVIRSCWNVTEVAGAVRKYKFVSSALFPFGYTFSVFYSRRTEQQQRQQSRRGFLNIRKLVQPAVLCLRCFYSEGNLSSALQSRGFIDYFDTKSLSWSFAHCKTIFTILKSNISDSYHIQFLNFQFSKLKSKLNQPLDNVFVKKIMIFLKTW